jgi:hypothetical protein
VLKGLALFHVDPKDFTFYPFSFVLCFPFVDDAMHQDIHISSMFT